MRKNKHITRWRIAALLFMAAMISQVLLMFPAASAVSLNWATVRLNRMAKSTAIKGMVCATPSVVGDAEGKVLLTFPAGFTVGASWTTDTGTTTGWPAGAQAWPTIQATGTGSGQTVTFTSGDLTSASTVYCFNWTNTTALTTPGTTGSYTITLATQTSGSGALESTSVYTYILDTNCGGGSTPCDQIAVTASVGASFTFSLSSNSAALGNLSTSSPTAATPINATISSNAAQGWQMWAADPAGTPGLTSTTASKTIAYSPAAGGSGAALSNGVEGYNLGSGTLSGTTCGTPTYGNFAAGGVSYKGSGLDGTLRTLVSTTGVASACALPLTVNASISAITPAASDYAGTITVVAAGNF